MLSRFKKVLTASALSLVVATAAHAADKHKVAFERVSVRDLVDCTKAIAIAVEKWCR